MPAELRKRMLIEELGLSQEKVEKLVERFSKEEVPDGGSGLERRSRGMPWSPVQPADGEAAALLRRLAEVLGDGRKARIYGQILPALWSAIQAAGRAIRGPEDEATVFMVDDRYIPLTRLLPRWFSERIVSRVRLEDMPIILEEVEKIA
ncbi:MAG: helicase C-terminal domain-containing protein [Candidatus Bathyarchaeia archaeon]